jgi:hypothetical protein
MNENLSAATDYDFERHREDECEYLRTAAPKRLGELREILVGRETGMEDWYADLLWKVTQSVDRVCNDLLKATEDPDALPATAWNARNLTELWVWTRYCSASRDNSWQFHSDALRDYQGLCESLSKMCKLRGVDTDWDASARKKIAAFAEAKLGLQSVDSKFGRVAAAAKAVALDDWFGAANTFLSKFAHPTAVLVMLMHHKAAVRNMQTSCLIYGTFAARYCVIDLEQTILKIPLI